MMVDSRRFYMDHVGKLPSVRVKGLAFRVQGLGFRVEVSRRLGVWITLLHNDPNTGHSSFWQ